MVATFERQALRFAIRTDERTVTLGKTKSGKSFLMQQLVRQAPRLLVCDSKGTVTPNMKEWGLERYTPEKLNRMVRNPKRPGRLCVPPRKPGEWADFFASLTVLRNTYINIDELGQVGASADEEIRTLCQIGREIGLGMGMCAQRPTWIPLATLSEAEWYIIFQSRWKEDQERLYDLVGETGFAELRRWGYNDFSDLQLRQFLIFSVDQDQARLYNQLDVKRLHMEGTT